MDRRRVALRGLALVVAAVVAFLTGRALAPRPDPDAGLVIEVSRALDRGQDYWRARLPEWRDAKVVLIDRPERTPCGVADQTSGPFYCPADERVYLDLSFLRAVEGELARAYVIAHELGHHAQKVLRHLSGSGAVAEELEADCLAGAWIRDEVERGHVENGDVELALAEAAAVGDDRVCPTCSIEQWTHGSSAQRVAAVRRGIEGEPCR